MLRLDVWIWFSPHEEYKEIIYEGLDNELALGVITYWHQEFIFGHISKVRFRIKRLDIKEV